MARTQGYSLRTLFEACCDLPGCYERFLREPQSPLQHFCSPACARARSRAGAALAESGQQTPIVVVAAEGQADRYAVIDSYKRIKALDQLGRDMVEAVVWPISEAEAVLLDRSLRLSEHETALDVGWLLAELEQRFGCGLDELARRFNRSVSCISPWLALVEVSLEAIQQQVREDKVLAQVARSFWCQWYAKAWEDSQRMAAIFAQHHCDTCQLPLRDRPSGASSFTPCRSLLPSLP